MESKCNEHCSERAPACIPFFAHENTIAHMDICNKRMLVALLAVCVTFIVTIIIFVHGYTVREKNWLDTLSEMNTPGITEVEADGVYQQPNP